MNETDKLESAVLDHVRRYRIGVPRYCWSALRSQFPELTKQQTNELLTCLQRRKGFLQQESLFGNRRCYALTDRYWQVHAAGTAKRAARPRLSERAVTIAWAMLMLCCGDDRRPCKRLLKDEFSAYFSDSVLDKGNSDNYYLCEGRLGYLRVDFGGRGRWDRIVSYCARDLARHERQPAFGRLMRDGYFEMTVATCTPQKARRLRQFMARRPMHEVVAVDVVAFPELLNLVSPPPIAIPPIPR